MATVSPRASDPAGAVTAGDGAPGATTAYDRFAGYAAITAAVLALVYAVAFVVLPRVAPSLGDLSSLIAALALSGGAFVSAVVLVAVYERARVLEPSFALLGLAFGLAGAMGAGVHGAYDLANAINVPTASIGDLPHPVDPRGFLTFFVAGLGLLVLNRAASGSSALPARLVQLGYLLGVLLIVIYLGRLIVLRADSPLILYPGRARGDRRQPALVRVGRQRAPRSRPPGRDRAQQTPKPRCGPRPSVQPATGAAESGVASSPGPIGSDEAFSRRARSAKGIDECHDAGARQVRGGVLVDIGHTTEGRLRDDPAGRSHQRIEREHRGALLRGDEPVDEGLPDGLLQGEDQRPQGQ